MMAETKLEQKDHGTVMELEHAIGCSTTHNSSIFHDPTSDNYVHVTGGSIVICDFHDPHKQVFLRHPGHAPNHKDGMVGKKGNSETMISSLALSRNGTFLAAGYSGHVPDVYVWDMARGRHLWQLEEHDEPVISCDFSHDERLLLTVGADAKLVVWDVKTGGIVALVEVPPTVGQVLQARWGGFAKDVKRRNTECYQFATCGDSLCTWILNPFTGRVGLEPAAAHRTVRRFQCIEFVHTPDTVGRDGYMDEWIVGGTTSGDFVAFLVKPSHAGVPATGRSGFGAPAPSDAAMLPPKASFGAAVRCCRGGVCAMARDPTDENTIVVGGADGSITVYEYDPSRGSWIDGEGFRARSAVCGLSISRDGREVLAETRGGQILRAGRGHMVAEEARALCTSHCGAVTGVAMAPAGNAEFATCALDGTVKVWSLEDYSLRAEAHVRGGVVPTCVAFSFDAVISGWSDGRVRCHHAHSGEQLWEVVNAHPGGVTAVCLSGNKRFLVTGGEEGELRVWELRMRGLVAHLKEHSRPVTQLVVFEDDIHAMSCSRDRSLLCWDLKGEKRMTAHTQRMGGISDMALSHDETMVITVGQERTVSFWDLRETVPVFTIESNEPDMHAGEATCVAVSANGRFMATGGDDELVKLWQFDQGGRPILVQNNQGHSGTVTRLVFSNDDRQLISVSKDGAIFVWNIYS